MNTILGSRRRYSLLMVLLTASTLLGCERYHMRGMVVEGSMSHIRVVDKKDPRLQENYGLPLAMIESTLDPDRLSRKPLPREVSDVDGTFGVPIDETGAGYLDYYVRVTVHKKGYATAVKDIRVPTPNQRLLVTLTRGEDTYEPEKPDVLRETLEMSEPYMR